MSLDISLMYYTYIFSNYCNILSSQIMLIKMIVEIKSLFLKVWNTIQFIDNFYSILK